MQLFDGLKYWYSWAFSDSLVQLIFQEKQKADLQGIDTFVVWFLVFTALYSLVSPFY